MCESSRKVGRRGKKIPATSRAVADGFVVRDRPAADGQGPWGFLNRAGARAFGTELVVTEALELGAEDLFDGSTGEGLGHVDGQRFDRVEIQIEPSERSIRNEWNEGHHERRAKPQRARWLVG